MSLIIPCHDDLLELKLLLRSIRENSYYHSHELVITADRPTREIVDYLVEHEPRFHVVDFGDYYLNSNYAATIGTSPILCFLTADCVVGWHWDRWLLEHSRPDNVVSCYTVTGKAGEAEFWQRRTLLHPCGVSPEEFDMSAFLELTKELSSRNRGLTDDAPWYIPLVVHRRLWWNVVGGWDTFERHPQAMDDWTFNRIRNAGIPILRTLETGVYHF